MDRRVVGSSKTFEAKLLNRSHYDLLNELSCFGGIGEPLFLSNKQNNINCNFSCNFWWVLADGSMGRCGLWKYFRQIFLSDPLMTY